MTMELTDLRKLYKHKGKRRRGQIVAVEQVIIFGLGVLLILFIIGVAFNFVENVQREIERSVGDALLNYLDAVAHNLGDKNAEIVKVRVDIPQTIASHPYLIQGKPGYLVVVYPSWSVDKRTDITYDGESLSTAGKAVIYITSKVPDAVFIK